MLSFDPATHIYKLDGVVIPSVTQVLADVGLSPDYPAEQRQFYLNRGTAVHRACELLVAGKLDKNNTDPRLHGYVDSFDRFLQRTGFKPDLVEHRVWSEAYLVGGSLDYCGPLNGVQTILDVKSGEPAAAAALQTAAYAYLLKESHGLVASRRLTLRLDPDGGEPKPEEYMDFNNDLRVFLSAVAVWHWRARRNLIK
jgi:hypothetical protein